MDLKRDLFISEEIISYLQSTYQNIYSDTNIIKNYVRYKELLLKKETAKTNINYPEFSIIFTANDEEELETLNRYFYGNSDGSNSGDGNSLAYTYLSTIDTIKELINKSDNSIKDVVTNLTALLDNPSMSDEAYKKYLNELIIPGILGTSEITSEKTSNTISTGSTIENEFSKTKKEEYKTELVAEQEKRIKIDQKIKLDKETNERTLLEEKQKKLAAETALRTAKIEAKDKLIAKNKQTQKEEKKEIILNKIDIIDEDINVKLETINDIIKKKIYEKSIINYFKGEDDVDDDGKEEEEDKKKDKEKKPALYAGSDEKKIKEIGLLQVKLNKQLTLMKEYTFQLKIELKFPSFMKHLYEFLLSSDKRTPISEDKRKDLLKKIEECDKQIEEIKKIESDSSYILKISNENIKTLLFFISFDSLYINKISNQIDKLKKEIQKKTGGGNKNYPSMLKDIYKNLNKTSDYKIDTKIEKKTDKLLLSYIRLYNLYIQPIQLQLKTLKEQSETKDKDNLPKDLLLLYDNFKKEYNDFIKENKEILEPEEDIKKITDKLAKKTSQKKIETDIIKIEIVALFDQYEQLAINYKNSEKYTKPITLKGGKNIKVEKTNSDLNLIKKTLEGYLEKIKKIEESEKPAKNEEMKTKINKILLLITIFNNSIGDTVNDANDVMSNIKSNISRAEAYIGGVKFFDELSSSVNKGFTNLSNTAVRRLKQTASTISTEVSNRFTDVRKNLDGIVGTTVGTADGKDDNLDIGKENEYYAEYNEIFKAAINYNKDNLKKDEYVRIKNKYLDEIIDSFYQIQEYYNDFFATRLKKEVDELLEEVKKIILKFKTLKYLNKYDKNILEFKEKLDKLKKKLKEYSDLNYDENNDLIDDTEDINEDPSINVINKKIASKQKEKEEKEIQKKTKEQEIINVQKEKKTYQEALDKNILTDKAKVYTSQQLSEIKAKIIEKTTEIDAFKVELSTLNTEIKAKNYELQELEQQKADKNKDLRKNKKQEDIKKQGNDKNIEKNKEFISKITKQYEEYEKIISNYEKTIAIIRIIKKKLNKIIYDKISDKETFKYIKKKYIKCYIDYYLYLIIQKYILKLEKLEKLTSTQDEKFIQNIETTYDKEIDDYKEAFYKSINEIITSDNNKLYDLLKSFFNEKLSKLLTTDENYDRFDDYQIYLIINLLIKLDNTEKKEALKSIAYDILFNEKDIYEKLDPYIKEFDYKILYINYDNYEVQEHLKKSYLKTYNLILATIKSSTLNKIQIYNAIISSIMLVLYNYDYNYFNINSEKIKEFIKDLINKCFSLINFDFINNDYDDNDDIFDLDIYTIISDLCHDKLHQNLYSSEYIKFNDIIYCIINIICIIIKEAKKDNLVGISIDYITKNNKCSSLIMRFLHMFINSKLFDNSRTALIKLINNIISRIFTYNNIYLNDDKLTKLYNEKYPEKQGGGYDILKLNKDVKLNTNIFTNIDITDDSKKLITDIYLKFLSYSNKKEQHKTTDTHDDNDDDNDDNEVDKTLKNQNQRSAFILGLDQTGGNNNIIDIKKTYDLYYTTNSESLIIEELLKILKTSENVIYFLLIINTSLSQLFKDLRKMLINFYEIDILLSYYYDENEIIYYIFLNYIYANYKLLLNLSKKDIIINIGKIKTRENYGDIYNKLEELFKNREIMEKLILFIKSHLIIPKSIIHPIKTKDTEYLLLYIYKYSKKEEKTIKGYDSFLTFVYLNLLNKFNNKIDDLPTFNLYNFSNLKKSYYNFELSSYQHQLSTKLMKDVKLLIAIISERYKYIEHKKDIRPIFEFTINDEILDYLNIFGNDELFRNYKEMSIMDLYTLNKNVKINIEDIKEPNKQDNIIFNIILLSSYIFKDDNIIPVEIYCKLVKHYFLTKNTKILNDLVYAMIVIMNRRINKSDIHRKLIKELSIFNIDLSEIKIFINPENKKINIIELLEKINFSNYIKSDIRLIIPFLYHFYKTDNKLQYTIEDLLCKQLLTEKQDKLIMYGGATSITSANSTNPSEQTKSDQIIYNKAIDLINEMFSNKTINEIENQIKKIDNEFKEIPKLEDLDNEFNKAISMDVLIETKSHKFTIYSDYVSESKFDNLSRELIKHCTDKDQITTPHSPESMKYKSLLNSKLIDIEKFKTKLEEVHRKKFEEKKTEIIRLYEPFENLINKIKSQPEIHDYPYIKEIYKQFIKNDDKILDEKQKEIKYDINKYFDDYSSKVLDVYKSMIKDIIDDRQGKLPNLIKNLDDIITNNKQQKYKNKDQYPNPYIGGNKYENKIYKGGKRSLENYDVLVEDFNKRIIEKDKKLVNMYKNLKRLKGNREIDSNVEKKLATPDFYDNDGNNIFERLIATYDKDINDKNMPIEITNSLFYDKVKNHNLDPEEELEITLNDKLIFIVLVYCIRVGSLLFCYYLINNNLITDINKSLFYYLIFYYAIFVLILLLINIDTFKMRILVNYMNLHVSTTNIWMHLILMGSFIYLIYLLIVNILGEEKPPTELGDHEKIKLKYKLDLLTIIIYTFIIILIFII